MGKMDIVASFFPVVLPGLPAPLGSFWSQLSEYSRQRAPGLALRPWASSQDLGGGTQPCLASPNLAKVLMYSEHVSFLKDIVNTLLLI